VKKAGNVFIDIKVPSATDSISSGHISKAGHGSGSFLIATSVYGS